jgi:hypothetical protein
VSPHCEEPSVLLYVLLLLVTVDATVFHGEKTLLLTRIPDSTTVLHNIDSSHSCNEVTSSNCQTVLELSMFKPNARCREAGGKLSLPILVILLLTLLFNSRDDDSTVL